MFSTWNIATTLTTCPTKSLRYLNDKVIILQRHTPINNNDKLISYAQDILEGLKYIHNSNVIHDDIKLENILM